MNSEPNHSVISEALYFDTNALRQLSHGIENVEFLNLRQVSEVIGLKFFAPEVAIMEWIRQKQKEANDSLIKMKTASKDISRLLSCDPIQYKEPDSVFDKLINIINNYIESAGIEVIPTPDIPLKMVIEMAVNRKPPFEEKGEKGFRDTIILFTILDHIRTNSISNAIIVSADAIFCHKDVIEYFTNEGKTVTIAKAISDAKELLQNQIDRVTNYYIEEKKNNIRSFLNAKFADIVEYILTNAEVSEYFLKGDLDGKTNDMLGISKIKRIIEVRPKEIVNIFPGFMISKVRKEGAEPVTFSVSCEFELLVEGYGLELLFNRPKVKLTEDIDFDQIPFNYPRPREFNRTITREITIEALISIEQAHYTDLSLIKVRTY